MKTYICVRARMSSVSRKMFIRVKIISNKTYRENEALISSAADFLFVLWFWR
jgi:hypothetical protein